MAETVTLAEAIAADHDRLDVLINSAGVYEVTQARTKDELDARFAVNTLAPYLLPAACYLLPAACYLLPAACCLLPAADHACGRPRGEPVFGGAGADRPLRPAGRAALRLYGGYAQSKAAIAAWTRALADELGPDSPVILAVNPAPCRRPRWSARASAPLATTSASASTS